MEKALADRPVGGRKRWWVVALASLLAIGSEPNSQPILGPPPVSLFDARLVPLRTASARWEVRQGPDRQVIDQVYLVPNLATFLEAIAGWDREHYYPILIEDAESTLRFLRAFRPSRIVRVPPTTQDVSPEQIWARAAAGVRRSWRAADDDPGSQDDPAIARPPASLGPTPPGVVLSSPTASMLAGAVTLAAGRFQPLVRFESRMQYGQILPRDEFDDFTRAVTAAVARVAPDHLDLGDDCDFVTIAGDYPYRYRDDRGQIAAVDDGLARSESGTRWAYAGRLLGDPAASVYRAMCSLFLQLDSATLFNGYDESSPPWSDYSTRRSALRLARLITLSHYAGRQDGNVAGWFDAFDPENRSSLVWINSHGSPTVFHLQEAEASTSDVPRTVPCSVVMIHSFSAADPTDPATIAGRWLANGAFTYFGSVNEPYLQAFRTPNLAVDLLIEHLPLVAALRSTTVEPYGVPWRLAYLGDPLYRLAPRRAGVLQQQRAEEAARRPKDIMPGRLIPKDPPAGGAIVTCTARSAGQSAEVALRAAVDSAFTLVGSTQTGASNPESLTSVIAQFTAIERDTLAPESRRVYDSILADLLFSARRRGELRSRIESIPLADRSPELGRWLDAIRASEFAWTLASGKFSRIVSAWERIIQSNDAPEDFRRQATSRVGAVADDANRRGEWAAALRSVQGANSPRATPDYIKAEINRIEAMIRQDRLIVDPIGLR